MPTRTIESLEPQQRSSTVLEHLAEEFLYPLPADHQRLPTCGRRSIHAPIPSAVQCQAGSQVALAFHGVQDGIERTGAHSVAVRPSSSIIAWPKIGPSVA